MKPATRDALSDVETYSSLIASTRREIRENLERLAEYADKLAKAADQARHGLD